MATQQKIPVFDGHNDVLLRLWSSDASEPEKRFLEGENVGHIDLPRAQKGGSAAVCAQYTCPHLHENWTPMATSQRQARRMR